MQLTSLQVLFLYLSILNLEKFDYRIYFDDNHLFVDRAFLGRIIDILYCTVLLIPVSSGITTCTW